MKKNFMHQKKLGKEIMSKVLFAIALLSIVGCSSKSIKEECYPNPGNHATYGVPQKWRC